MNSLDKQYQALLQDVLDNGTVKDDRTGTGTISVFGRTIRHNMKGGFPLLTTKKMYWKGIVSELLWFLRGRTDLRWLLERDNKIWVGDAYKNFVTNQRNANLPILSKQLFINAILNDNDFNNQWGDLGKIYGQQWRSWFSHTDEYYIDYYIDQIKNVIELLENNPDSRRMVVNAWNVAELDEMKLSPCHYSFQFYTRELTDNEMINQLNFQPTFETRPDLIKICQDKNLPTRALSITWIQRSADLPLGIPYNIFSYSLLLALVAKQVNMIPEEVIGNLGDTHIYLNQVDGVKEQLSREVKYELPQVVIEGGYNLKDPEKTPLMSQIKLVNYQSDETIKFPLSN